jgi:outer membrane protein OmpA-like peptidoglycan-associated protein
MIKTRLLYALLTAGLVCVGPVTHAASLNGQSDAGVLQPTNDTQDRYMVLQNSITPFLSSTDPLVLYQAHKAQSWADYAKHQTFEGGLTSAYNEGWVEAERIVSGLEQNAPQTLTTTVIASSGVMRRDLWATAELLKKHPAFASVAPQVAEAEVTLVWAAAEYCEMGWHHAREHFSAAERLLVSARATADLSPNAPVWPTSISYPSLEQLNGSTTGCHGVVGPWPLPVPDFAQAVIPVVPVPDVIPPMIEPPVEVKDPQALVTAPNNVHFALNRSDLSPESRTLLDQVAAILSQYPEANVTLYGHTDPRASVAYNDALSARRARSVEKYLVMHGVAARRIATEAKGKQHTLSDADAIRGYALSRRVEIVYINAGHEVVPQAQAVDLQLER